MTMCYSTEYLNSIAPLLTHSLVKKSPKKVNQQQLLRLANQMSIFLLILANIYL